MLSRSRAGTEHEIEHDADARDRLERFVMTDVNANDIRDVIQGIARHADETLRNQTEADLEQYWFFSWDGSRSAEWNTYEFTKLLELYRRQCRRWEEMHNGSCCVVERVRDKYLMPKIREFIPALAAHSS